MIGWLKKMLNRGPSSETSPANTAVNNELYIGYKSLLIKRLAEFSDPVGIAFANLFQAEPSTNYEVLHIEVFLEEPAFWFRAFSMDAQNSQTPSPSEIIEFNVQLEMLWPIMTQDELDQFTVWEDDPKWGRQVALKQPIDELNIPKLVLPWLKKIVTELRGDFAKKITANVHDITLNEEW